MSPAPERATGDALCDILANAVFFPDRRDESSRRACELPRLQEFQTHRAEPSAAVVHVGGQPHAILLLDQSNGGSGNNLNMSEVFDAISLADPSFDAGGALVAKKEARTLPPAQEEGPRVRIVEQPASMARKFRYECEERSSGSIPGVNSTADRKTYPTIEIVGHTGKAIVVVSCVTREEPYKPHPHKILDRDRGSKGVYSQKVDVTPEKNRVVFSNLGIQCIRRRDIAEVLKVREELKVDPFLTGFGHRNQPQSIDLNSLRLCFQVFVTDDSGRVRLTLPPVVSNVIYNKKGNMNLQILRLSHSSGPARGGSELIVLCDKVAREDIAVVVYEERRGSPAVVWEEAANIVMVHKQHAIAFTTPPYRDPRARQHVEVMIQLKRLSDGARGQGVPFTYIPEHQDTDYLKRKRQKTLHTSLIQKIEHEASAWQGQTEFKVESSEMQPMEMSRIPGSYTPLEQWIPRVVGDMDDAPSPSRMSPQYYSPDMQWANDQQRQVMSRNQVYSPQHQQAIPLQVMSPEQMQVMTPQFQRLESTEQVMLPLQMVSPQRHQAISPELQEMLPPKHQQMIPQMVVDSLQKIEDRQMHHISSNLIHQQQMPQQVLQQPMETNSEPSLSGLLAQADQGMPSLQLNSGDLSTLSALLNQYRPNELTDSLNRISTSDLLPDMPSQDIGL